MIELTDQQLTSFAGLLNQLAHHNCLNRNILEFLNSANSNMTGTIAAVKMTGALKSLRDFRQIQENYQESLDGFTSRLSVFFKNQHEALEKMIRKHNRNSLKILKLSGRFPVRDSDSAITPVLDLQNFLNQNFQLLSELKTITETTIIKEVKENQDVSLTIEELEKLWGVFLNSKNWQFSDLFKDFQTKEKDSGD